MLDTATIRQIAMKMELHETKIEQMMLRHEELRGLTDMVMLQLAALGELFGDTITGQLSAASELNMSDGERRKHRIPPEATYVIWAYQGVREGVDLENLTDEQTQTLDKTSGEFAFASLGSFIYVKPGEVDEPPVVLAVNALGVGDHKHRLGTVDRDPDDNSVTATIASPEMWDGAGIGLETDIYAFGIVMWEVWTRCEAWHWMGAGAEFQICNRVGVLKQRPRMPPFIGTHASRVATMIRQCLHHDPSKRPTAENLVEAQMEMVNTITKMRTDSRGPVREASVHEMQHQTSNSSDHSEEQDTEQFWTSAGKFTLHPNRLDSDSGTFSLTVNEVDANEWMENAL